MYTRRTLRAAANMLVGSDTNPMLTALKEDLLRLAEAGDEAQKVELNCLKAGDVRSDEASDMAAREEAALREQGYMLAKAVTCVPTGLLVDDIQALTKAVQGTCLSDYNSMRNLLDMVESTIECLAEHIENDTRVMDGVNVHPSGSSVVSAGGEIIAQKDGEDVVCATGRPISLAMQGGICQCDETCAHYKKCFKDDAPRYGRIAPRGMELDVKTSRDDIVEFLSGNSAR